MKSFFEPCGHAVYLVIFIGFVDLDPSGISVEKSASCPLPTNLAPTLQFLRIDLPDCHVLIANKVLQNRYSGGQKVCHVIRQTQDN